MKRKKRYTESYKDAVMPVFLTDIPSYEFIGYNPELLSSRYSWGAVKLPKGKSWNNDAIHFRDTEYVFSKISLYDAKPDLYLKFYPVRGRNFEYRYLESEKRTCQLYFKQHALYLTIRNYAEITAFQVINDFRSPVTGDSLGRHFEDGILTFWQSHGLPLM